MTWKWTKAKQGLGVAQFYHNCASTVAFVTVQVAHTLLSSISLEFQHRPSIASYGSVLTR
jgi:hypothetical protein